jgi:hypothetical protein
MPIKTARRRPVLPGGTCVISYLVREENRARSWSKGETHNVHGLVDINQPTTRELRNLIKAHAVQCTAHLAQELHPAQAGDGVAIAVEDLQNG